MTPHTMRIAKHFIGQTLNRTGLWDQLLRRWARRHQALILTYHRVIEKWDNTLDYSQPGMVVTAETFDRQLAFFKEHFDVVPLSLFAELPVAPPGQPPAQRAIRLGERLLPPGRMLLRGGDRAGGRCQLSALRRPLCAITFDDGWRDNYALGFPILRKHDIPATIFLTTDFVGTDRVFWHTELIYLLLHGHISQLAENESPFQAYPSSVIYQLMRLARMRPSPRARDVDPFIQIVKETCDEDTIEQLILDIATTIGVQRPLFHGRPFFLDWNQVREMTAVGVEIGSHGCSHRIMTRLKAEEAEQELVQSKAEIEQRIGRQVPHFAFPNGNFNRDLLALAWKAGYRTACLCGVGGDEGRFGPLALQRVGMAEGVSRGKDAAFSEASLQFWLLRAPRVSTA